jgi:hypothetical protein
VEIESADPAVKAGLFAVEAVPFVSPEGWFGKWAEMGKFETVYFGFLNRGPNSGQGDAETAKRFQAEHLAYMDGQFNEGKLVVAGPITVSGARREAAGGGGSDGEGRPPHGRAASLAGAPGGAADAAAMTTPAAG